MPVVSVAFVTSLEISPWRKSTRSSPEIFKTPRLGKTLYFKGMNFTSIIRIFRFFMKVGYLDHFRKALLFAEGKNHLITAGKKINFVGNHAYYNHRRFHPI
ncbi:hypothetical protein MTBPR1_30263 [Candidatus Terasakiella magnetica]|uniref:Uncharacterized protein n=1 Tax=Candidatus Terasakiella magnetica TaxID=1867952 RepID=A0A1C3RHY9_9PROT|nr:hypothetical protein MTBPR1_30263 [Candidatus Terasakiella magnetica]